MQEVWKDVVGYEGYYQISNLGRVKSLSKMIPCENRGVRRLRRIPERIMKLGKNECGYLNVKLVKDTKRKGHKVHRLVAEAFIPNPEEKRCVNHIDGNKENNCVENLEWCTHQENMIHATKNGLATAWSKGKHYHWKHGHSEETKRKISEAKKGTHYSWGHGHTEEAKRHISEAKKNRTKDKKAQ